MEKVQLKVSEFIALANQTLENAFPSVEIVGEVSGYKVNQGKYVFFDLKDESGSLGCFATVWQIRTPLEDGMQVVVVGSPRLTAWGKFSITLKSVAPVGAGSLKRSFDLLVAKLQKEGLFEEERKRPLPKIPRHVGVISSTQAAGYADFIRIVNERWGGVHIEVAHVQVQGASAPQQMIRALRHFNERSEPPEVLVIIRGGGSIDDLSAFNDEPLVRAIAASRIPTLVGVGHETDTSLADLVADLRAATPSHAAQLLVPDRSEIIGRSRERIKGALESLNRTLRLAQEQITASRLQAYDLVVERSEGFAQRLSDIRRSLQGLNPEEVLKRGYALLKLEDGSLVRDGSGLALGERISVELYSNIVEAKVESVHDK